MACIDLPLDVILHCKKVNLPLAAPNLGIMAVKSGHGDSYVTFFICLTGEKKIWKNLVKNFFRVCDLARFNAI
jgi:hypothetical protein